MLTLFDLLKTFFRKKQIQQTEKQYTKTVFFLAISVFQIQIKDPSINILQFIQVKVTA